MKNRGRLAVLVLITCAAGVVVRLMGKRGEGPVDGGTIGERPSFFPPTASDGPDARLQPPPHNGLAGSASRQITDERRAPVEPGAIFVVCRDEQGSPVAGAQLSLTPLQPAFLAPWVGWGQQDWDEVKAASSYSRSDSSGRAAIPQRTADAADSLVAIWVTHEEFLPALLGAESFSEPSTLPGALDLRRGSRLQALVVDGAGHPVAGAVVEQMVAVPGDGRADALDPQGQRVLLREHESDEHGIVDLAAWEGTLVLRARIAGSVSAPWIGEPQPRVTLVLAPSFTAGGSVTYASPVQGTQRIRCWLERGTLVRELDLCTVEGGQWGPMVLPLLDADRYGFRLEGYDAEMQELLIPPPPAASDQRIDFTTRPGSIVAFKVEDEQGQAIFNAVAEVTWDHQGKISGASATTAGTTEGVAVVGGVPPGTVNFRISAPGYAPDGGGPYSTPSPEPIYLRVVLKPARRATGRVLRNGSPVRDFEIVCWEEDATWNAVTTEFHDREDGSFVLESVPRTTAVLVANAPGLGSSRDLKLAAGKDPVNADLEIEGYLSGTGRVVDSRSGQAIAGATLQPHITSGRGPVAPLTPPLAVDADGSFQVSAFELGKSRTKFSAPGYSTRWIERLAQPGEELAFGLVALSKRQPLVVRIPVTGGLEPTRYAFTANGVDDIPMTRFDSSGTVRVPEVSAGIYSSSIVEYRGRDEHTYLDTTLILEPGEQWDIEYPVGGSRKLRVEVADDGSLPPSCRVRLDLPFPGRRTIAQVRPLPESLSLEFDGLLPGPFTAQLLPSSGEQEIARASGVIDEKGGDLTVRLVRNVRPARFRVVDGERQPLLGAHVVLFHKFNENEIVSNYTNDVGECAIPITESGEYRCLIRHSELGTCIDVPVMLRDDPDYVVELVFEPKLVVEARLLDGDVPLPGVGCMLWDKKKVWGFPHAFSGMDGTVSWSYFTEGTFQLEVKQSGYWYVLTSLQSRPKGQATTVQLRRTGSLEILAKNESGIAVGGQAIGLTSLELQCDASGWLADKLISTSTGQFATDGEGRLRIDGLPRGDYLWSLLGPEGVLSGGKCTVPPHGVIQVSAYVP